MTTRNKPLPPTIKGLRDQFAKAIQDTIDRIDDQKKKLEQHKADKMKMHQDAAAQMERHKADPKKVHQLVEAHEASLADHEAELETLKGDLKAFEKERGALESQLRTSPSLAD